MQLSATYFNPDTELYEDVTVIDEITGPSKYLIQLQDGSVRKVAKSRVRTFKHQTGEDLQDQLWKAVNGRETGNALSNSELYAYGFQVCARLGLDTQSKRASYVLAALVEFQQLLKENGYGIRLM